MSRILRNTRALIFIIAILLIANIAMLIFIMSAKPTVKKDAVSGRDRWAFTEFLKKDIRFSQEQIRQYDSLRSTHWKIMKPLFRSMNAAKDGFYIHISDSVVNDQLLLIAIDSIAIRQRQMDLQLFAHFRDIRRLCTAGQKPLFDSLSPDLIKKMINPYRRDVKERKNNKGSSADSTPR
ncbi:MAG: hypothetical protein H7Y03_04715 [Chitinophagaceae bacterium]|nr:hypothetical protein [Chitinophagaceae bacterium]